MSYKPLDDRQIVQRSALSTSIGSAANTTLDSLFSQIDSVMVNLNGSQTLSNKILSFLRTNFIVDSSTTGSSVTISSGDIANGIVILTNSSLISISGISAGVSGQFITIENQTGNSISINNNDSGASAGNKIYTGTGAGVSMPINSTFELFYDSTIGYWMLTGAAASAQASINANYGLSTANTIGPSPTLIIFDTLNFDTNSAYNTSTGLYTAPISGKYRVSSGIRTGDVSLGLTEQYNTYLYKNGTLYCLLGNLNGNAGSAHPYFLNGSNTVELSANDTVSIYAEIDGGSTTEGSTTTNVYFAIEYIGS